MANIVTATLPYIGFDYSDLDTVYQFKKNDNLNKWYVSTDTKDSKQYIILDSYINIYSTESLSSYIENLDLTVNDLKIDDATFFLIWFINHFKEEKLTSPVYDEGYIYKYTVKQGYGNLNGMNLDYNNINDVTDFLSKYKNSIFRTNGFSNSPTTNPVDFPWYLDALIMYRFSNFEGDGYKNFKKINQNEVYAPFLYTAEVMGKYSGTSGIIGQSVKGRDITDGAPKECYKGQIIYVPVYGVGVPAQYYICTDYNESTKSWNIKQLVPEDVAGSENNIIKCSHNFYEKLKSNYSSIELNFNIMEKYPTAKIAITKENTIYPLNKTYNIKCNGSNTIYFQISDKISYANKIKEIKLQYDFSNLIKQNIIFPNSFSFEFYYKGHLIGQSDKIQYTFSQQSGELHLKDLNNINISYKPFFSGGIFFDKYGNISPIGENYNLSAYEDDYNSNIKLLYGGTYRQTPIDAYNFLIQNDIATLFSLKNEIPSLFVSTNYLPSGKTSGSAVLGSDNNYIGTKSKRGGGTNAAAQDCYIYLQKNYDFECKICFFNQGKEIFSTNNNIIVNQSKIELEWNNSNIPSLKPYNRDDITSINFISRSFSGAECIPKIKLKSINTEKYSYGYFCLYDGKKKLLKKQFINFSKKLDDDENLFYCNDIFGIFNTILIANIYTATGTMIKSEKYFFGDHIDSSFINSSQYIKQFYIEPENVIKDKDYLCNLLNINKNIAIINSKITNESNFYIQDFYFDKETITNLNDFKAFLLRTLPNNQFPTNDNILLLKLYDEYNNNIVDLRYIDKTIILQSDFEGMGNTQTLDINDISPNSELIIAISFGKSESAQKWFVRIDVAYITTEGKSQGNNTKVFLKLPYNNDFYKLVKLRRRFDMVEDWENNNLVIEITTGEKEYPCYSLNSSKIDTVIDVEKLFQTNTLLKCDEYFEYYISQLSSFTGVFFQINFTDGSYLNFYNTFLLEYYDAITKKITIKNIKINSNKYSIYRSIKITNKEIKVSIMGENYIFKNYSNSENVYIQSFKVGYSNIDIDNSKKGILKCFSLGDYTDVYRADNQIENNEYYSYHDYNDFSIKVDDNKIQYINENYNILIEDYIINYNKEKKILSLKNIIIDNPNIDNFITSFKSIIIPGHGYNFYIRACQYSKDYDFKNFNLFYSIKPDPNYIGEYIRVIFLDEPKNTYSNYSLGDEFAFKCNIEQGALTQNFEKTALNNYSKYPKFSIGNKNYFTGSINCLLGDVKYREGETTEITEYRQSIDLPYAYYEEMDVYNKWLENIASGKPALIIDQKGRTFVSQITDNSINMFTSYGPKPSSISFSFTECDDFANIKILEVS